MSQPPIHLNLMRRRKQQYRLRRRRFVVPNSEIFSPQLATTEMVEAPAAGPSAGSDSARLREKLRTAEAQSVQQQADLRTAEAMIRDFERRLAEKDAIILQKDAVITEAKRVVDEAKAQILRNRQDVDVQRKRLAKEKEELKKYAAEDVMRQILSPLDHFTLAVEQWRTGTGTGHSLGEGMQMVFRELMAALEGLGLTTINTIGEQFDPAIHDAVSKCQDPSRADGEVVRVLRPGFRLQDKILRPAIVEVNKLPGAESVRPLMDSPVGGVEVLSSAHIPTPPEEPPHPDAVMEVRTPGKEAPPSVPPRLKDTHSSPLDRARRMLETKFDDTDGQGVSK